MPQTDYVLTLDDKQVRTRLRDVNGRFIKMGETGDDAMKKVGKSSLNMSNIVSGAAGGAFAAMAGSAIEFGKAAVSTFANVIKSSTLAAAKFDVTKRKFVSIFEGGEKEAGAVMEEIGKKASSLGLDLNEALSISRAFLPDVKGTEDPLGAIENLLVGVRALGEEDPAQGIIGARIAIDEAMSGSLRSLRQRFEFTKAEIDILKQAQTEFGQVIGTIEGINQVMQRRGVDVEALKGTFTQALGEMQFATSKLQIALGKPIADELTESLGELNKLVNENSDDFQLLASAIGDIVAKVVDFIGTNLTEFLGDIDTEGVLGLVDALGEASNSAELLFDVLFDLGDATSFNKLISALTTVTGKIKEAGIVAAQISAIAKAENAQAMAEIEIMGHFGLFADAETKARAAAAGQIAYDDAIRASLPAFEKFSETEAEDTRRKEERKAALDENTAASLADAEAFLKEGDAAQQAASELEKLGLSEEKLQAIQKNAADTLDKRLELEKRFSQQRADIHRKGVQDIADIESDYRQDIVDAGRDLSRSARDLALKQGAERSDAETQNRRQLIDIEEAYQDELGRIQRQTQLSLESAELSQDALAFVDALRQQEIAQEEAAITRGEAETDIKSESEQRLADLEVSQAAERAALDQSQQDKLLDLQLSLEQELAEQRLAEQRSFEQQAISEQRKLDSLAESEAAKLAELTKGLDAEVAAVIQAEAAKLSAVEDFATQAEMLISSLASRTASISARGAGPSSRGPLPATGRSRRGGKQEGAGLGTAGRNITPAEQAAERRKQEFLNRLARQREIQRQSAGLPRMFGGSALAGHIYRVGERGVEGYVPGRQFGGKVRGGPLSLIGGSGEQLFAPPTDGNIIPNNQLGAFLGNGGTTNNSNTEINFQPKFELSNPAVLSPEQAAQTRAIALSVASQMFKQVLGGNR